MCEYDYGYFCYVNTASITNGTTLSFGCKNEKTWLNLQNIIESLFMVQLRVLSRWAENLIIIFPVFE